MNLLAYRDRELFMQLCRKCLPLLDEQRQALGRKIRIMEVCGTHTAALSKTGVREVLAEYLEFVSGPGCPVCVTDQSDIDQMIAFAQRPDAIVATFGDMMRVPGSSATLAGQRAEGAEVRVVYSPAQAVQIALENPHKQVVLLGVGFETTAPSIALSIKRAAREGAGNYFVYAAHKLTPPALGAMVEDPSHQLDGFLLPGHVSAIIGRKGWGLLERLNQPAVIAGFEPVDLLVSAYLLVKEMKRARRSVVNNYARIVREEGNPKAQSLMHEVFEVADVPWRGFGELPGSGLVIRPAYRVFDAGTHLSVRRPAPRTVKGCRCSEIVKGKESPFQCPLFASACTPESPLGPCMVSSEGTCATYFQFERDRHTAAAPAGRGL